MLNVHDAEMEYTYQSHKSQSTVWNCAFKLFLYIVLNSTLKPEVNPGFCKSWCSPQKQRWSPPPFPSVFRGTTLPSLSPSPTNCCCSPCCSKGEGSSRAILVGLHRGWAQLWTAATVGRWDPATCSQAVGEHSRGPGREEKTTYPPTTAATVLGWAQPPCSLVRARKELP